MALKIDSQTLYGYIDIKKFTSNSYHYVIYNSSPTSNCQMCSIAAAYQLPYFKKSDIEEFFKWLRDHAKRQVLVDIRDHYVKGTLSIFTKNGFKVKNTKSYTSTNGSKMKLIILIRK